MFLSEFTSVMSTDSTPFGLQGPTSGPPLKNIFPYLTHQFWAPSVHSHHLCSPAFCRKKISSWIFPLSVLFKESKNIKGGFCQDDSVQ